MSYAPPSIGSAGMTVPVYADIIGDLIAEYQAAYGQNVYLGVDSADYQWISAISAKIADNMLASQLAYNSRSPLTAVGAALDGLVKLAGIARKPASYSTAVLTVTGTAGATVSGGVAKDGNGYLWALPATVTIGGGGTVAATATCTTAGSVTAAAATITTIATPQAGWVSVTNSAPAAVGQPVETDGQLRARYALSVAGPSETMLAGTIAAIAATANVTRYNVLENPTGSVDANGNPAHSITAVVEGGANADIAEAIYLNHGIGCNMNGTTSVTVTDSYSGALTPVGFTRPSYVPIYVSLSVHALSNYTTATTAAIQADIVAYLNSLQIGQSVVLSELYGAALQARPSAVSPMFSIRALTLGTSASPTGTSDIALTFSQVASGVTANVVITLV